MNECEQRGQNTDAHECGVCGRRSDSRSDALTARVGAVWAACADENDCDGNPANTQLRILVEQDGGNTVFRLG